MAITKSAEKKKERNQEIVRLHFEEGWSRPRLAERFEMTSGGISALLAREKGKKGKLEIVKKRKVEKEKKIKIEKSLKPKIEEEQRIAEQKIKKGFMIYPDTWKKIMLYRVNHSDQSFSEIVEKAILKFLKEK